MAKLKLTFPTLRQAPSVVLGTGSLRAATEAGEAAAPVLFLCSASGRVPALLDKALEKGGWTTGDVHRAEKPAGEPTWDALADAADLISGLRPRTIVAVGGGSVLDWARLAWARAAGHLEAGGASGPLPADARAPDFWLVPTTCGTGAEAGDVAVYTTPEGNKSAVISPDFLAAKVVLDGRFLESLESQPGLLSGLLCDTLSHGIEANLSVVPNALGKTMGVMAVRGVLGNLAGGNRNRLMEAGFLGGVAAANCSVGIVHAFAHSTGVDGVGHGLANAAALVAGMRFNAGTEQMTRLLDELDMSDVDALCARLAPAVRAAMAQPQADRLRALLADAGYRATVAARMAADVALRSNPRRAGPDELAAFVETVAGEVQA